MRRVAARGALGLFALLTTHGFLPSPSDACSICLAGDPIYDAQGASAQQKGDLSAYLELRGWTKRSGLLPEDGVQEEGFEDNDSKRLRLMLSWTPTHRLTLSLNIPAAFNTVTENAEGEPSATLRANGLGDISVGASVVLWRNREILPGTFFEGRAWVKAPTGPSEVETEGVLDPHVQPGTGSWDFGFGMAGTHRLSWGTAYTSAFYRVNTLGSLEYEYGNVFLWNGALQVPLGHASGIARLTPLTVGLELNFRWAEKDIFESRSFEDSGGSILYVTPSLRYRLPWFEGQKAPALHMGVQVPTTNAWLNGFQEEGPVWYVGFLYPFSL